MKELLSAETVTTSRNTKIEKKGTETRVNDTTTQVKQLLCLCCANVSVCLADSTDAISSRICEYVVTPLHTKAGSPASSWSSPASQSLLSNIHVYERFSQSQRSKVPSHCINGVRSQTKSGTTDATLRRKKISLRRACFV